MPDSFPPELINLILSYLSGTPSIVECALVCLSWLPTARYHLLPPPKVLHLDQIQIVKFLHLIDSPRSTLSLVSVSTLHLAQNRVDMDWSNPVPFDGNAWRNHTAIRDFLVRDFKFSPITSLFLEWVDWRTLSPTALTSLHSSYKSVKELELRWIAFTSYELCNLVAALTALEKLTVGAGAPFDSAPWTVDAVQMTHPSLCKLSFSFPPSWMIQFFTHTIGYAAGIVEVFIDIRQSHDGQGQQFKTYGGLLDAAGTSLRALKLRTSHLSPPLSVGDAGKVSLLGTYVSELTFFLLFYSISGQASRFPGKHKLARNRTEHGQRDYPQTITTRLEIERQTQPTPTEVGTGRRHGGLLGEMDRKLGACRRDIVDDVAEGSKVDPGVSFSPG